MALFTSAAVNFVFRSSRFSHRFGVASWHNLKKSGQTDFGNTQSRGSYVVTVWAYSLRFNKTVERASA